MSDIADIEADVDAHLCLLDPGLQVPDCIMDILSATYNQRWAKVTTLREITIFLEALFQLEKRL